MLATTLRVGESVTIGERIVIKVLEVQGQKVQLGVEAPKDVKIGRPAELEPGKAPVRK